jgi:tetratricopeptide (TPR) repeat protein
VQCYRDALAIAPDNRLIHGYLALALVQAGDNAGAMQQFHLAVDGLQRDRNLSALCSTLGSRLMERGTVDAARAVLNESLRLRPRSVEALNTLAVLEFRQRRLPEALAFCNAALAIDPQSAATRANRGVFLVAGGQTEAGLSELMRAVELAPRDVATRGTLADALLRSGQPAAAIEQFRQGLRLQVDWWEGCWRLGWLLATLPDDRLRNGREALELATRYRAASGERDPRALDLLAAAEAEMGDFDRATTSARRAVELWRAADSGGAAVVAAVRAANGLAGAALVGSLIARFQPALPCPAPPGHLRGPAMLSTMPVPSARPTRRMPPRGLPASFARYAVNERIRSVVIERFIFCAVEKQLSKECRCSRSPG